MQGKPTKQHTRKTLERVIRKQVVSHLETNDLMDPYQHGSRHTDFAKAYDEIDHVKHLQGVPKKVSLLTTISGKKGHFFGTPCSWLN